MLCSACCSSTVATSPLLAPSAIVVTTIFVCRAERISEFERLLHVLAERSREMNSLCDLFPEMEVPSFLSCFERDLATVTQHEQTSNSPLYALRKGHGIVKRYAEGPTLFFSASPAFCGNLSDEEACSADLLAKQLDPDSAEICCGRISLEFGPIEGFGMSKQSAVTLVEVKKSTESQESAPTETLVSFDSLVPATPANMTQPPINFMLVLNRPVAITMSAARALMRETHGSGEQHRAPKPGVEEGFPFFSLLARTGFIPHHHASPAGSPILMESVVNFDIAEFHGLAHAVPQRFYYAKGAQPSAIMIQRIPFVHINQLLNVLQV